ncbi:MAG: YdcF family protein [Candidatus Altimarinota bacterium]
MNVLKAIFLGLLLSPFLVLSSTVYQVNFYESGWETKPPADCLMVMGAKVLSNNQPDLMMRERINTAKKYISEETKHVILTGGTVDEKVSEAEAMKSMLVQSGIDEDKILLETNSTSTYQNLLYSQPLIEAAGCEKLDIVSHDFHLARIKMTADNFGISVNRLIPAEKTKPNTKQRLSREYLAYLWYWFGWEWLKN